MRVLASSLFILFCSCISLNAQTYDIEMLNKRDDGERMVFSQDILYVTSGDTVNWLPTSPGHNVEFIAAPDIAELPKKPSKVNKEYSYTFTEPGIYFYQCSPHKSMGMIAFVVVDKDISNIEDIKSTRVFGKSKKKLEELLSYL